LDTKISTRKVSFQGPPEEIDIYGNFQRARSCEENAPPSGKQSKWEPLSTVDPSPIVILIMTVQPRDSEDEKESRTVLVPKEIKMMIGELKKAAAEAIWPIISRGPNRRNLSLLRQLAPRINCR